MDNDEDKQKNLPGPWREIQGAIWLIGLAVLFWQGWFWPGILVLVAISGIFAALVNLVIKPKQVQSDSFSNTVVETNTTVPSEYTLADVHLPSRCPNCGAPISSDSVTWSPDHKHASCPYCKSNISTSN